MAANALAKLIKWVDQGIAPPTADRLVSERRDGPIRKDGHGNALGGLRSVQVDIPIAAYFTGIGLCTYEVPFGVEKLAQLYGAPSQFVARVRARVDELVAAGWYLAEDADSARGDATQPALEWIRRDAFSGGDQSKQ